MQYINRTHAPTIGEGVYTIPDVSRVLSIAPSSAKRWLDGYWKSVRGERSRGSALAVEGTWGYGSERAINFYALIELFMVAALREAGNSLQQIRRAREELTLQFGTRYPFASHKILSDGRKMAVVFGGLSDRIVLELGGKNQTALRDFVEPFCLKLKFSLETKLAESYWPLGVNRTIVVSPYHAFGRPVIAGTNITTEVIYRLLESGEHDEDVVNEYEITSSNIADVREFEGSRAA